MTTCDDCGGTGIDSGSLNIPEDCLMCGGYGDRLDPEQIEAIARRQMERAKTITEKLPAGYFEERVWRFGA